MRFLASLLLLVSASSSHARVPAAPSNLRVKAIGVNAAQLQWKDNSNNESGFEIQLSLGSAEPETFQVVPTVNATSYLLILPGNQEYPGLTLNARVLAYNGAAGAEKRSRPTTTVSAQFPDRSTFEAPTALKATALTDASIRLSWLDNSNSEHGYEINYRRKGSAKWLSLGTIQTDARYDITAGELARKTAYEFRVRAFKQSGFLTTSFSNSASAETKDFQPPSKLVATPDAEGSFRFRWRDNSGLEAGYVLEAKTGDGEFASIGEYQANTSATAPLAGFNLATRYSFRVRAFRLVKEKRVYSAYSPVTSARSLTLAKPADFKVARISRNSAKFTWKDQSKSESGYELLFRRAGTGKFQPLGNAAADATSFETTELRPGSRYEFRLRATSAGGNSPFTPLVRAATKDGITSTSTPEIFFGTTFRHEITVSGLAKLEKLTVRGLPAGLRFRPATRVISGKPTSDKLVTSLVTATFADGTKDVRRMVFRIVRPPAPPVKTASFGNLTLATGATNTVPLAGKFSDPDVTLARRVTTTMGAFDMLLYPQATPATVQNFLTYANGGKYNNVFFHRSVPGFVVQGGGYTVNGSTYGKVATRRPVRNEPGISNTFGTIAMAKLGGDPDSATSQWFVSVADNSENLDAQNGGFTVFGRVAEPGMAVLQAINDLPGGDYRLPVGSATETLEDVPVNAAVPPVDPDPATFVKILSVTNPPVLRYEVSSSDSAIATAAISSGNVSVTGGSAGSAVITVKAIDLDGQETSSTFTVSVPAP